MYEAISLVAVLVGLGLAAVLLPQFNAFTNRAFEIDELLSVSRLIQQGTIWICVALMSGLYPALFLSSFSTVSAFREDWVTGRSGVLQQGLVVFQFALAIALIASMGSIRDQLTYLRTKNLGIDRDEMLIVSLFTWHWRTHPGPQEDLLAWDYNPVKQAFTNIPGVKAAATYRFSLGERRSSPAGPVFRTVQTAPGQAVRMASQELCEDFVPTFGVRLIRGRNLSANIYTDRTESALLNASAARMLGWGLDSGIDPIGQVIQIDNWGQKKTVIGVVEDFHLASLHEPVGPVVLFNRPGYFRHIALKIDGKRIPEIIQGVKDVWDRYLPERPPEFAFLDERLQRVYDDQIRLGRIAEVFTGISLFLAGLGLFGITALAAARRTREIGIRKAIGATPTQIVRLMSSQIVRLIALGAIIAFPLAHWYMSGWLSQFEYRIDLSWTTFFLGAAAALIVGLSTVGYHSVKTAFTDPTQALRET